MFYSSDKFTETFPFQLTGICTKIIPFSNSTREKLLWLVGVGLLGGNQHLGQDLVPCLKKTV